MIRPRTLSLLVAGLALATWAALPAHAQVGGAAAVFLQIEPDSRAAGMGNAGVALADNASAIFWNPAGLARQRGAEIALTHANWLPALTSDLFYEYLAGKYHVEGLGTLGAHVTFLWLGEQEYRDDNNVKIGDFRSFELATGVSLGVELSERLALGTGARLIYSNLTGGVAVGGAAGQETKAGVSVGVDLAALYTFAPVELGGVRLTPSLGANLANMGPKIGYTVGDAGRNDPIPTNLRFGGALRADLDAFNRLNVAVDFNKSLIDFDEEGSRPFYEALFTAWRPITVCRTTPCDEDNLERVSVLRQITVGTGLEYWYNDLFAFRTGFFFEDPYNGNRQFLTFGAGIRYNVIGVDFSYLVPLEEQSPLADTIRFSLLLNVRR